MKRDFVRRTDALALKLNVTLDELPDRIGFSRASLFGYRGGDRAISGKAWLKLRKAEEGAGIETSETAATAADPTHRLDQMDARLSKIEALLENLINSMGKAAPTDGSQTSSEAPGKKLAS